MDVVSALESALSAAGDVRGKGEAALSAFSAADHGAFVRILASVATGNGEMSVRKLAAVLLRRSVKNEDDSDVLEAMLRGCAHVDDGQLQGMFGQVLATVVMRGNDIDSKVDRLLCFAQEAYSMNRLNAVCICIKCLKVASLNARELVVVNGLVSRITPLLLLGLKSEMLANRSAFCMRKFLEAVFYLSPETVVPPSWWDGLSDAVWSIKDARVKSEIIGALRVYYRLKGGMLFEIAVKTLRGSVDEAAVLTGYDSDDGSPKGTKPLQANSIECIRESFPGNADIIFELMNLCVQACVFYSDLGDLFVEDPNEFVALHEDDSAPNFPRQSGPGFIDFLVDTCPLGQVIDAMIRIKQTLRSEQDVESGLWLAGNLWISIAQDEDRYQRFLSTWIIELVGCSLVAPLKARVLWSIWACWSDLLAVPEVCHVVVTCLKDESQVVALYACRAFGRIISDARMGKSELFGLVPTLHGIMKNASLETVHIAVEAICALFGSIEASGLDFRESGFPSIDLVRTAVVLWGKGADNDPLVCESLLNMLYRLTSLGCDSSWVLEATSSQVGISLISSLFQLPQLSRSIRPYVEQILQNIVQSLQSNAHDPLLWKCFAACVVFVGSCDFLVIGPHLSSAITWANAAGEDDREAVDYITKMICTLLQHARHNSAAECVKNVGSLDGFSHLVSTRDDGNLFHEISMCSLFLGQTEWLRLDNQTATRLVSLLDEHMSKIVAGCVMLLLKGYPALRNDQRVQLIKGCFQAQGLDEIWDFGVDDDPTDEVDMFKSSQEKEQYEGIALQLADTLRIY
uniref:Uncharacterized protein n=1 Tax=Mucochytrium quahogii TaxID=96639 RepID=A0A7S2S1S8_9STRA|mmetsp:Transcript_11992/g.22127  ORF Transcript_11992/g.22127 Transcript_11992/m.22127 type:complete len:800 (+) Transcript_11992:234-2633(+)